MEDSLEDLTLPPKPLLERLIFMVSRERQFIPGLRLTQNIEDSLEDLTLPPEPLLERLIFMVK
jgi:hypothetical protein